MKQNNLAAVTQYSLEKILLIWLLVTLPNFIVMWIVVPGLIPHVNMNSGILFWTLIIVCLMWQFLVSLWLLRKEVVPFNWINIKQRLWVNKPIDPTTGKERTILFLWLIPCLLGSGLITMLLSGFLDDWIVTLWPAVKMPPYADISRLIVPAFKGKWWLLGYAVLHCIYNYILGEELLFRGILLPRMSGVFGKWDWVANSVLFGFYHLHKPWMIPSILAGSVFYAWPTRRLKCIWMSIIVHGVEGVFVFLTVIAAILGLKVN